MTRTALVESMLALSSEWELGQQSLTTARHQAAALLAAGKYEQAKHLYSEITEMPGANADDWRNLGRAYLALQQGQEAGQAILRALRLQPWRTSHHLEAAKIRSVAPGSVSDAEYSAACNWDLAQPLPTDAAVMRRINVLVASGSCDEALSQCEVAALHSVSPQLWLDLSDLLEWAKRPAEAARARGFAAFYAGEQEEAVEAFRSALEGGCADVALYRHLIDCYSETGQSTQAEAIAEEASRHFPGDAELDCDRVRHLRRSGRVRDSAALASNLLNRYPDKLLLKFAAHLALPAAYRDEAEIAEFRSRYAAGLDLIECELSLRSEGERQAGLEALLQWSNFYLPYQGLDDRELQMRFGRIANRIMAANFPRFAQQRRCGERNPGGRIRVGYISRHFRFHSVSHLTAGWLRGHHRERIETFTYYVGDRMDAVASQFQGISEHYRRCSANDLEGLCRQIDADRLDVLVFADIGMAPITDAVAALRLAPVQCVAWGHPETTGLPTIDYFLSGDLMEPGGGEGHYSERLVRLPNLGVSYQYPGVPGGGSREDFGLPKAAVRYLSCQSVYKYLPQHDFVYAAIAQRVPGAQFVFLRMGLPRVDEIFEHRLQRAFAQAGLDAGQFCVHLPMRDYATYRKLMEACDVYLDTMEWSGGNTTFEAVASCLPVVTLPGRFMRGRHSYAIVRMLEMDELIAQDGEEYVAIASRLGANREWRDHVRGILRQRQGQLFEDPAPVPALEEFYERAVEEAAIDPD